MTYSGDVEWRSPAGTLVQFEDSGELTVTGTTVTVSSLIPGTSYQVRVSAVTLSGRGDEVTNYGLTEASSGKGTERSSCMQHIYS